MMMCARAFAFHAERRTAAARGGGIRVLDGEPATRNGVDEVHFRTLQLADAHRIHIELDAVRLVHLVTSAAAFLNHEAVLEA